MVYFPTCSLGGGLGLKYNNLPLGGGVNGRSRSCLGKLIHRPIGITGFRNAWYRSKRVEELEGKRAIYDIIIR